MNAFPSIDEAGGGLAAPRMGFSGAGFKSAPAKRKDGDRKTKKIFILAAALFFICSSGWGGEPEKGKLLVSPRGTYKLIVPEKAPDFLCADWQEEIIGMGQLPNGDVYAFRLNVKENMAVASLAFARKKGPQDYDYSLLVFVVSYDGLTYADWYFDEEYIQTGIPSGRLSGPVDAETGRGKMKKIHSRIEGGRTEKL